MIRAAAPLLVLSALVLAPTAAAYPSMIRHGQTACSTCHVDPSGSGLVTPYGRAQRALLLPNHYGKDPSEVDPGAERLFGLITAPDWLNAGVSFRGAALHTGAEGAPPVVPLVMAADARVAVDVGPVRASASIGFSPQGARLAALTDQESNNIVSREHCLGVRLLEDAVQVRAGRINVPFGLRNPEHVAWVRSRTRTDIVSSQQYGLAAALGLEGVRAELLGIAGNFLLRLPEYRELGYAGYVEAVVAEDLAVGLSSLVTRAQRDLLDGAAEPLRQAHGVFARWSPAPAWAVLVEANALLRSTADAGATTGLVTFAQVDWEAIPGVHLYLTGETLTEAPGTSVGGWLSASYFFLAWGEVRVDAILRRHALASGPLNQLTVVAQLHLSL